MVFKVGVVLEEALGLIYARRRGARFEPSHNLDTLVEINANYNTVMSAVFHGAVASPCILT